MPSAQLCGLCNNLEIEESLREILVKLKNSASTGPGDQQESSPQPWHPNLPAVLKSSATCALCKLVLQGLREARRQLVEDTRFSGEWAETPKDFDHDILIIPYYSNAKPKVTIMAWSAESFEKGNMTSSKQGTEDRLKVHAVIRVTCSGGIETCSSWDGYSEIFGELRISSHNGSFDTNGEIDRTSQQDPASTAVFDQLQSWISLCSRRHKKCNEYLNGSGSLPSRVLNISPSDFDSVYLEEPTKRSDVNQPYAALSHCWGASQPFITTSETLEERKQGISIAMLPQTYQDAIIVTRRLGLQYLWIDSLCIIQNDTQDWEREAAKMAAIYRDANIVIGASNSSADSEGFLHKREADGVSVGGQFEASLLPPEAQRLSAISDPVKAEPLSSRAWTLQERYLPHRMISYGRNRVFWECSEMTASEDGDCLLRDGDRLGLVTKTAGIEKSICGISGQSPGDTKDTNYFDWYETVKEYTSRHITKTVDRLPALAGLAKAVSEATGDEYLAGIWQRGFIEGLLWCKSQDKVLTKLDYRAPSWSWASVDGIVNFTVYNFYDRCTWKYMMANFEFTATYVDSFLEPTGENLFGGIKNGWICLKAPLFPITSIKSWDKISYRPPGIMMDPLRSPVCDMVFETEITHKGKRGRVWLDGGFDIDGYVSSKAKLFALFLARLPDPGSSSGFYLDIRFGIILEATTSKDEFKRVGIIDGTVKVHKVNLPAKLQGKLYLEPVLHKTQGQEGDDELPNLLGPDPYEGLEQKIVKIV